ncbi:MAG TPA: TetR/AcrR family transcriptional regulator [Solirubrobacterales bacterium]|jgi:AcrR family transcriptional regulator
MTKDFEFPGEADVLMPTMPLDIGARAQEKRILTAMAKSCAEKTFSRTTIADIVSNASISRATFYKHFANKRECFDATTDAFLTELRRAAQEARPGGEQWDPDSIRTVMAAILQLLAAKPDHAQMLVVEAPNVDPDIVRRYRDLVVEALKDQRRAVKRGGLDGADPELAFGRAKVLVAAYLSAGKVKQLPSLLPELVYIALLPYLGQEGALEQAQIDR